MKARVALFSLLLVAGCGGTSEVGTSAGHTGTTTGGSAASSTTTTTDTSGPGGSTGGCRQNGAFDFNDPTTCCSGEASNNICEAASTGASGTTGTPGTGATGTTTGGTCPQNMPDISSGQTTVVNGSCSGELNNCPPGFTCTNGQCILNGANGGLQVTLSWDTIDYEDLDLHVVEPGGCGVMYNHRQCVGSLDRDSNAGCQFPPDGGWHGGDGVNIENVIYPSDGGFPSGTYKVYVAFYEECDSHNPVNYGVQVRANGQLFKYCGSISAPSSQFGDNGDYCDTPTCGKLVTTFTVP